MRAAEYRLDVIAASVGPVVRKSILESYDGNKCYLLSTQILAKVTLSRLFFSFFSILRNLLFKTF